jgi:hypothetical protein
MVLLCMSEIGRVSDIPKGGGAISAAIGVSARGAGPAVGGVVVEQAHSVRRAIGRVEIFM